MEKKERHSGDQRGAYSLSWLLEGHLDGEGGGKGFCLAEEICQGVIEEGDLVSPEGKLKYKGVH